MKKLLTVVTAICIVMAASAQHRHGGGGTRVVIVRPSLGVGFGYSAFYYSPFGYNAYGYPYGDNSYRHPSRLDVKVDDIQADYRDKIRSARHDNAISKDERKKIVQQLKADRKRAIRDLKTNYYKRGAEDSGANG